MQSALKIVANENRYHPVRDYLNGLQWDGTERIRYALHHFLGADTDDYTFEALPPADKDGFREITEEEARQMELPF